MPPTDPLNRESVPEVQQSTAVVAITEITSIRRPTAARDFVEDGLVVVVVAALLHEPLVGRFVDAGLDAEDHVVTVRQTNQVTPSCADMQAGRQVDRQVD